MTTYNIDASLENYTLSVTETIHYHNNTKTNRDDILLVSYVGAYTSSGSLPLYADGLAYPFGVNYASLDIECIKVNNESVSFKMLDEMYISVPLKTTLKPNKSIDITIKYSESIPKNRLRYGYNSTSINLGNAFIRVVPPYNGEYVKYPYSPNGDPFYDEVANFDVRLVTDKAYNVVMTGEHEVLDNVHRSHAEEVRDFAIVLSDRMSIYKERASIGDRYIDVMYMTENREHAVDIATIERAMGIFSGMFGDYPYDSIAVVENDFVEGGMEYPGLVYVTKNLDAATREKVIIHELAHEWWYGVVGVNENVDYIIDEGLAELSTYLYYKHNGEEQYADALMKKTHDAYITYHAMYSGSEVMNLPLDSLTSMEYYAIAYLKAPLLFKKVMEDIGEDRFLNILSTIYSKYKYKNINMDEFLREFGYTSKSMKKYVNGKYLFE